MNLFQTTDFIPGSSGKIWLGENIQGEQYQFKATLVDADDNPINLDSYTITAKAVYYEGQVTGSGASLAIDKSTVSTPDPAINDKTLTVTKLTQSGGNVGRFDVLIPSDLYAATIDPTGDTFPIAALFWELNDGAATPEIRKQRINLVIRYGG